MLSRLSRFTDRLVTLTKRAISDDPAPLIKKGDGGYADSQDGGLANPPSTPADLHDTGDVQAIDATGFDRHLASRHSANRTDYTFRSVKTTALVDCETSTVLDIHCSMKQPHDTHVGRQVLTRNLNRLQTITADKGYDWDDLREELRDANVRPVIKHREFYPLDVAHNARHDEDTYHRRSIVEAVFFAFKQRYGDTLRARMWFGQFRKLVLKAAVRNIELAP